MAIPSNPIRPGTTVRGKISYFGGPTDSTAGPTTASGASVGVPGIALYNRATLGGYWRVRAPNGRTAIVKQTDLGPAPWTGRAIDFTYSSLGHFGYSTGNFPTDSVASATYLGRTIPKGASAGGGFTIPGTPASSKTLNFKPFTASNTASVFNQKAFKAAQAESIAGSYLRQNAASPFDIGPKTGLEQSMSELGSIFPSTAPNPQDYTSAVKILQQIAGRQVKISHPGTPGLSVPGFGGSAGSQGYVNPIPGADLGRTDMGIDATLPAGHPIVALGDSKVVGISPDWYRGQPYVLFQLTSGPARGRYYYIAEAISPTVRPGQTVRAGQMVGRFNPSGTGLELGWGSSTPGRTLAQATTGYSEGQVTSAGKSFRNFLGGLH